MIGNLELWRCSPRRALVLMLSFLPPYRHHVVVAELSSGDTSSFLLPEQHPIPKLISTFVVLPLRQPSAEKCHTTKQSSNHARGVIRLEFWKRAEGIIGDNYLSKGMNFSQLDDESYDNQSTSPEIESGSMFDDDDDDLGSVSTIHSNSTDTSGSNVNFSSVAIVNDNSTTSTKRNRWKRLSIPRSLEALLPGKPLFMRLVPIKSIDIVSKILDDIQPQNVKANWFELLEQERITEQHLNLSDVSFLDHDTHPMSDRSKRRRFFQRNHNNTRNNTVKDAPQQLSKEELECAFVATNVDDLQTAVLIKKIPLREVGFRFPIKGVESELIFGQMNTDDETTRSNDNTTNTFQRHDPIINGSLSSLLTHKAKTSSDPTLLAKYEQGIELLSYHPVLSLVRERVQTKSKPGRRLQGSSSPSTDTPHLALVIEGGGMRGAVSAGMAAALSTLDLLDAFDSIHGSSAGSIVGAYLVSRQLCMDVYTDVMPAAGKKFVSRRGGMLNFGVDWLSDLIQRKLLSSDDDELDGRQDNDELCVDESDTDGKNGTSWMCEEDDASSVELAMGAITRKRSAASSRSTRLRPDDQYGGIIVESMNHLLSNMFHLTKLSVAKPLSIGARRMGRALRPAVSALDVASSMRQYLRRRPGMNITYVLDGIMDESHGLRPFDVDAFRVNDKLQPLYIIASTVSNGGKGEMETGKLNNCDTFYNVTPECHRTSSFYSRVEFKRRRFLRILSRRFNQERSNIWY